MVEVGIEFDNYYLVGGFRFKKSQEKQAKNQKYPFLGRIEVDNRILEHNLEGKSLLELADDSPAYQSVKSIMHKAGY
jgi:CO dehydrogenase nickel-insertion accessory protein CooC1